MNFLSIFDHFQVIKKGPLRSQREGYPDPSGSTTKNYVYRWREGGGGFWRALVFTEITKNNLFVSLPFVQQVLEVLAVHHLPVLPPLPGPQEAPSPRVYHPIRSVRCPPSPPWTPACRKDIPRPSGPCHPLILKVTGHSKTNFFFVGFPPLVQDFFCYITCTFKRMSLWLFRKFHSVPPFWLKIPKFYRKYAKRGQIGKF